MIVVEQWVRNLGFVLGAAGFAAAIAHFPADVRATAWDALIRQVDGQIARRGNA